jgi:uncharacterized membrane protein YgcG
VTRDSRREPFTIVNLENGKQVKIGDSKTIVEQGVHTYTLVYETDRQLGFYGKHDELYWNVTGNGSSFPIENASATVRLPQGVARSSIASEAYTGPMGAKGRACATSVDAAGQVHFQTTQALGPREGLTIVVTWPKGFVTEPALSKRLAYALQDNAVVLVSMIGLAFVCVYYLGAWFKVGRDPARGPITPRTDPPAGLSPASLRFIRKMGYDGKCAAAAVLDMAVKGFLSIHEGDNGFSLKKCKNSRADLSEEERKVADLLLKNRNEIMMSNIHHKVFQDAIESLKGYLRASYEDRYFFSNRKYVLIGCALSATALCTAAATSLAAGKPQVLFLTIWLTFWSCGVTALLIATIVSWRKFLRAAGLGKAGKLVAAVMFTLFSIPFLAAEVFVLVMLASWTSVLLVPTVLGLCAVNAVFFHLLKAPTEEGRRVMDDIEGFRLYLTGGQTNIDLTHQSGALTSLYERYLPYSLALDVESAWTKRFSGVLEQAAEGHRDARNYAPDWYSGRQWDSLGWGMLGSSVGSSLSSAISSAATAPGSSSGSSDGGSGGSSGGGGGGGGVGGW